MITRIFLALAIAFGVIAAPSIVEQTSVVTEVDEYTWDEFHADVYKSVEVAFDLHFLALEFKRAKNGAPMIRKPGQKSFKFVAKGKTTMGRYQVWYGFAIKRFDNKDEADKFAKENQGFVFDDNDVRFAGNK